MTLSRPRRPRRPLCVPVHRGGPELTNFLSCLGLIRETRLTAVLGYLISRAPREFTRELLGRPLDVRSIRIEPSDEGSRYDVVLETRARRIVIEAKLGLAQRVGQVANYIARLGRPFNLVLVDRGNRAQRIP